MIPPSYLFYYDRRTPGLAAKSGFDVVETGFIAHLPRVSTVFAVRRPE